MSLVRVMSVFSLVALALACSAEAFDYDSYKPGNLDDVLALNRPKTGMDIITPQKLRLKVTLESYAKKCGVAGMIKLSAKMLRGIYPQPFVDALAMSQCVTVKSPKGVSVTLAIQDKVAEFLPKEVPLGTEILVYGILVCMTADGPGLVISEFEVPDPSKTGLHLPIPHIIDVALAQGMAVR